MTKDKMKKEIRPQFLKFFIPIVESLKDLGGSGTASEVIDLTIDKLGISEKEQQETIKHGESRVRNQAQWARLYLAKGGYISASGRGVWTLTKKNVDEPLTEDKAMAIIREQRKIYRLAKQSSKKIVPDKEDGEDQPNLFQDEGLQVLHPAPERVCRGTAKASRNTWSSRDML